MTNLVIEQAPQTIQLISPPESFFQNGVVVSLLSVVVGFLLGVVGTFAVKYYDKYQLKKSIIKDIFDEVFLNRAHVDSKRVKSLEDVLANFKVVAAPYPPPTNGPHITYNNISHTHYFDIYLKDFSLFEDKLRERLVYFYSLVRSIAVASEGLEKRFREFYSQIRGGAGYEDIKRLMDKLIQQTKLAHEVGTEILVIVMTDYKYSGRLPILKEQDIKLVKDSINKILETKKDNDTVTISELSEKTTLSDLLICVHVMTDERFVKIEEGNYRIMK